MSTGMIMVASTQVWPNILGLLHFCQQEQITHVGILHTGDQRISVQPANRIAQFCTEEFPHLKMCGTSRPPKVVLSGPMDPQPQTVRECILKWEREFPEVERWIINASGGLKLSSFGLLPFLPDEHAGGKFRVVYREVGARGWFEVFSQQIGAEKAPISKPFHVAPGLADCIPLVAATRIQSGSDWSSDQLFPCSVAAVVRAGINHIWNWNKIASELGYSSGGSRFFEQFVANILVGSGVTNVAVGVKRVSGGADEENDVLCLVGDTVFLIDCKLTTTHQAQAHRGDETALVTEVCDTVERANHLGGTGAVPVLLRPSRDWGLFEHTRGAKDFFAPRATIWDGTEMHNLISNLTGLVWRTSDPTAHWNEDVREAHNLLQEQRRQGRPVIAVLEPYIPAVEKTEPGDFTNLPGILQRLAGIQGHQHWCGYFEGATVTLYLSHPNGWNRRDANRLCSALFEYGKPEILTGKYESSAGKPITWLRIGPAPLTRTLS